MVREKIKPYRYQVYLDEANIQVDYAPSHQSAVYSIAFGNTGNGYLVFNSRNGEMKYSEDAVSGYQYIDKKTKVYLYVETDQKPTKAGALARCRLARSTPQRLLSKVSKRQSLWLLPQR